MMPRLIAWLFVGLFLVLGIVLRRGKAAFLIAGYNTMPREKKERYDEKALCRFIGKMLFALGACTAVMALGDMEKGDAVYMMGLILFLGTVAFTVLYINTGHRFQK